MRSPPIANPAGASESLQAAASRAALDPFFLGHTLRAYQRTHQVDDAALAGYLGCAADTLPRLRLCRRPAEPTFRSDVDHLCRRFGVIPARLATLLRQAEAVDALRRESDRGQEALLLAARDREEAEGPGTHPGLDSREPAGSDDDSWNRD